MDLVSIVIMLCIGNAAGWIATIYAKGGDTRLLGNVTIGLIGAFILGLSISYYCPLSGIISAGAMLGAALLLFVAHRLRRA